MDRFQAMKMFVAVVEAGGFSAAARKLDISPSVVSRVIGELEGHLGTILLNRTTRALRKACQWVQDVTSLGRC